MKDYSLIHVKFSHKEALEGKRDLLNSELNLLKIVKSIRGYRVSRSYELDKKLRLHRKFSELNTTIRKMQSVLPNIKIPEVMKEFEGIGEEKEKKKIKKEHHKEEIENQLMEIQTKLRELSV